MYTVKSLIQDAPLISGKGRPIDMEQKGCESSIHDHDID